jgi:putative membrane protein
LAHSFSKRISGTTPYYNLVRRVAFPSTRAIIVASLILTTLGLGATFAIANQSILSILIGAAWGIVILAIPAFSADILLYRAFLRRDPLFYFRRCLAFSLFTITTWVIVFFVSSLLDVYLPGFIFPDFAIVMGLFAVIPLRALAVFSMSRTNFIQRTMFTLLEPILSAALVVLVFRVSLWRVLIGLVLASLVGLSFAFALIAIIEIHGRKVIGFSPIRMFRAFLTDWLDGDNAELESYLNELGVETELDVAAFAFRRKNGGDLKAIMLVSNVHAGPFMNIGSSVLPFLFQSLVSRRYNAVALVPHGVSGHELNLVSQEQNERMIGWVLANLENARYVDDATCVIRTHNEIATATSQVFDGCALVSMTTAPDDMEDVPSEVANRLNGLTQGRFRHVALIDAHNSLNGPALMTSQKIGALEDAALSTLQLSAEKSPRSLRVGAARRVPDQFRLKDGFGPGGIAVIAVEGEGYKFAYVTIDGNNMVTGLREELLRAIKQLGYDDGEVMTTDTHMVNGVISSRLGYYRIGEVVPRISVLNEVLATCRGALASLEPCEVAVFSGQLPATTLGSKSLKGVMGVVYRNSKLTALTLFPVVAVIAALALVFLV